MTDKFTPESDPKKTATDKAVQMWRALSQFAQSARSNSFTLKAYFESEQQRNTPEGVWKDELLTMAPADNVQLFHDSLIQYGFTEVEIQDPLVCIRSTLENDLQQDQMVHVYIHVSQDNKVKVVEVTRDSARQKELSATEVDFIRSTSIASNAPAAILRNFGSTSEFWNLVQMGMPGQNPLGIDGVDATGWTLYHGGLAHFVRSLNQFSTGTLASSSEILTVSPLYSSIFQALLPKASD